MLEGDLLGDGSSQQKGPSLDVHHAGAGATHE